VHGAVACLAPRIKDSNHAARGCLLNSIQCGRRVGGSFSSSPSIFTVAAAAARRWSPGGSNATIVRLTVVTITTPRAGGGRACSTLTFTTRIIVSPSCASAATQKCVSTTLHTQLYKIQTALKMVIYCFMERYRPGCVVM